MTKCGYCGLIHETICPTIKAIEYYPDGTAKRVEFKVAADYGQQLSIQSPWSTSLPWQAQAWWPTLAAYTSGAQQ